MKEHTASEVYKKIQEAIDLMKARSEDVGKEYSVLEARIEKIRLDSVTLDEKLAKGYLSGMDVEKEADLDKIQDLTGLNLSGIQDKYLSERKSVEKELRQLSSDRRVLMKDTFEKGEEDKYLDDRIEIIKSIENNEGYLYLHKEGFIAGKHKRGFFWFKHRRLKALADETAKLLGYSGFSELMYSQKGLLEMRSSIPLLVLYPEQTVGQLEIEVDEINKRYDKLSDRVANYGERFTEYVVEELTKQFSNIKYKNLLTRLEKYKSRNSSAISGILEKLISMEENSEMASEDMDRLDKERSELSRKIGEYTSMLVEISHFKGSSKPIESRYVDQLFETSAAYASEMPRVDRMLDEMLEQFPKEKLDRAVARENPGASEYRITGQRVRFVSKEADPGLYERTRKAGGKDGKWTEVRRIR